MKKVHNRAHHVDFDQLSLAALRALNDGSENASDRHQTATGKVRYRFSRLDKRSIRGRTQSTTHPAYSPAHKASLPSVPAWRVLRTRRGN